MLPPFSGNHSEERSRVERGDEGLFPERSENAPARPMAGVVSLHELEHPIPEKAQRAAYEGQRLAQANKTAKAIRKLEQAVRIAPRYRDAHNDLGVQYARLRRFAAARAEFEKALAIGPPVEQIYLNLALSNAALGDLPQALVFAQKTLGLNPRNALARELLARASAH